MPVKIRALREGDTVAERFTLVRELGAGNMGVVYEARVITTGESVALKVMHDENREATGGEDDTAALQLAAARERFKREATLLKEVVDPHIVRFFDSGFGPHQGSKKAAEDFVWFTMELLQGRTLHQVIKSGAPFPMSTVLEVLRQICRGLAVAHEKNIVHRDLKPANIFIEYGTSLPFRIKLIDWGLVYQSSNEPPPTVGGGTRSYAAPEQFETTGVVTRATDVWPLGLIAFELLTGKRFWKLTDGDIKLLLEIVRDPIPLASIRAKELGVDIHIPPAFDTWFAKCVARGSAVHRNGIIHGPENRYPDAKTAYEELEKALDPVRTDFVLLERQATKWFDETKTLLQKHADELILLGRQLHSIERARSDETAARESALQSLREETETFAREHAATIDKQLAETERIRVESETKLGDQFKALVNALKVAKAEETAALAPAPPKPLAPVVPPATQDTSRAPSYILGAITGIALAMVGFALYSTLAEKDTPIPNRRVSGTNSDAQSDAESISRVDTPWLDPQYCNEKIDEWERAKKSADDVDGGIVVETRESAFLRAEPHTYFRGFVELSCPPLNLGDADVVEAADGGRAFEQVGGFAERKIGVKAALDPLSEKRLRTYWSEHQEPLLQLTVGITSAGFRLISWKETTDQGKKPDAGRRLTWNENSALEAENVELYLKFKNDLPAEGWYQFTAPCPGEDVRLRGSSEKDNILKLAKYIFGRSGTYVNLRIRRLPPSADAKTGINSFEIEEWIPH